MSHKPPLSVVYAGLDESGSLTSATDLFTMAAVVTPAPTALKNIIRRAALKSGKRLGRQRKRPNELKWHNASQRIRLAVLDSLAQADVELFVLVVQKEHRRIADTPQNYAILVCELLLSCWNLRPNMAVALDQHFSAVAQRAAVDTFIHHQWPPAGILTISHVDSRHNTLVQLADFVAGSAYAWHKWGDQTYRLLEARIVAETAALWSDIKHRWLSER